MVPSSSPACKIWGNWKKASFNNANNTFHSLTDFGDEDEDDNNDDGDKHWESVDDGKGSENDQGGGWQRGDR